MFCSRLSLLYICEIIHFSFTDNKRGKRRVWLKDMKHNDSSCEHLKLFLDQNFERVSKCRFRIRIEKSVQVRSIVLHCLNSTFPSPYIRNVPRNIRFGIGKSMTCLDPKHTRHCSCKGLACRGL